MLRRIALILFVFPLIAAQCWGAEESAQQVKEDIQILHSFSRAIAKVAGEVSPGVVSIYTTRTIKLQQTPFPDMPPMFEQFFGRQFNNPQLPQQREFHSKGLGSGFIIDAKNGYILTNNHVIDGAEDIKVRLSTGEEYQGKLVGADKKTDLAIVQIKGKKLIDLRLGDSDAIKVGEFVLAVGSPFGLRETVSAGIISAKGRSGLGIEDYEDFIQTDAAINVGNSGGPLVNISGEVIGVNAAIVSGAGGSVGVGFAIPINMAKEIMSQLIKGGKVVRGWLGVQIQDVTPDMAEQFKLEKAEGVLISQVIEKTPAEKAGLKTGDIVTEINGRAAGNMSKFRSHIAATPPSEKIDLTVIRDGKKKKITVEVGTQDDGAIAAARGEDKTESLGLSVQDLTPEMSENLGVPGRRGVVVASVDPSGLAADAGITVGDVILEVNRQPVRSTDDFRKITKEADPARGVLLLVMNRQGTRFLVIKSTP